MPLVIIVPKVLQHNLSVVHLRKTRVPHGPITVQYDRRNQKRFQMGGLVRVGLNPVNLIPAKNNAPKEGIAIAVNYRRVAIKLMVPHVLLGTRDGHLVTCTKNAIRHARKVIFVMLVLNCNGPVQIQQLQPNGLVFNVVKLLGLG